MVIIETFRSSFTVTRINGHADLVSPDSAMEATSRLKVFVGSRAVGGGEKQRQESGD